MFYGLSLVPDLICAHRRNHNKTWLSKRTCFLSYFFFHSVHFIRSASYSPWPRLLCGSNRRVDCVSQSVSSWQFYSTCTTLMGTITHEMIALHAEIKRQDRVKRLVRTEQTERKTPEIKIIGCFVVVLTLSQKKKKKKTS